ncbi:MAG TPA: MgtC/SapB family protein [Chroococcales cyanobacterium]
MHYFEVEMALRLLLAAGLGGLIGAERERRLSRGAGLRTHALVCVASALVMVVSTYGFMSVLNAGKIVLDPSRVAAQVVSGVGFLGAGIIIFRRNAVRGLTTAASIWAVAAIGLACGCGLYISAISGTAIMWFILTVVKKLSQKYFPQRELNRLTVEVSNNSQTKLISEKMKVTGLKISNMSVKKVKGSAKMIVKIEALAEERVFVGLLNDLQTLSGVESVEYAGHALPISDFTDFEEEQLGA